MEELTGPHGSTLSLCPDAHDARVVAELLTGQYWTEGLSLEVLAAAQLRSLAWGVVRLDGEVIASARAVGDGARWSRLMDVIVRPDQRARGFGKVLVAHLLDHPAVRDSKVITLGTRTPSYYEQFGFSEARPVGVEMSRVTR